MTPTGRADFHPAGKVAMKKSPWIRKLFTRPVSRTIRKASPWVRLAVETLEARTVPSTFTVLNTNDTGAGSLRDAVAQANANLGVDTIVFGDGSGGGGTNFLDATPDTIILTSGVITFAGDTALTTVTGTGANLLTISGGNTQGVWWLNANTAASLSGMTITGGNVLNGGGVNNNGTLTMTNVTVSGNTASASGGALFMYNASTTLTNCTVSGNSATGSQGGGI